MHGELGDLGDRTGVSEHLTGRWGLWQHRRTAAGKSIVNGSADVQWEWNENEWELACWDMKDLDALGSIAVVLGKSC